MICPACDSPDCSFVDRFGPTHWYQCHYCKEWVPGPEPVIVDFTDEETI